MTGWVSTRARVRSVSEDQWMVDAPWSVQVRVRHEPDRSYAVFIHGPDGEVQVGSTHETGRIGPVACEGADRLWGRPAGSTTWANLELSMPRPPYGRDGQWVRIVAVGEDAVPDDLLEVGLAGLAYWFGWECAWMVSGPRLGGIYPSEYLDFEPTVSAVEVEQMREHQERASGL